MFPSPKERGWVEVKKKRLFLIHFDIGIQCKRGKKKDKQHVKKHI